MSNPGKTFKISYSKMATFRRCLRQYHWKYIDKFFPPSGMGQARGTAGHAALAVWHVDYNPQKAMDAAWDNWSSHGYTDNEDWGQLERALNRYFPYSKENDKFKLVRAEEEFVLEYTLAVAGELSPVTVRLNGFIDGIVVEDGRTWLLENKFYKKMENNDNPMDMQISTYLLAAQTLGFEASGVIYNKVRIADTKIAETEPVVRTRQYRNPQGLHNFEQDMLRQVRWMIQYEKGGTPYPNITKDCSWDCAFHAACLSMSDDGEQPIEILKTICNLRSNDGKEE